MAFLGGGGDRSVPRRDFCRGGGRGGCGRSFSRSFKLSQVVMFLLKIQINYCSFCSQGISYNTLSLSSNDFFSILLNRTLPNPAPGPPPPPLFFFFLVIVFLIIIISLCLQAALGIFQVQLSELARGAKKKVGFGGCLHMYVHVMYSTCCACTCMYVHTCWLRHSMQDMCRSRVKGGGHTVYCTYIPRGCVLIVTTVIYYLANRDIKRMVQSIVIQTEPTDNRDVENNQEKDPEDLFCIMCLHCTLPPMT